MAIGDDFTIDYVNKRITHSSGTTIYTVNALYSYLMDTFDELDQMDDPVPMSAQTPTEYTLINAWFVDDGSFKFLKSGAIQTVGWTGGQIRQINYSATTGFSASDVGKTITGTTTGHTGKILAYDQRYDTNQGVVWIRPTNVSTDLFNNGTEAYTVSNSTAAGSFTAASGTGEALWSNLYTLGTIEEDFSAGAGQKQQVYIIQNKVRIEPEWWPEGGESAATRHIDVLIKVREPVSGGTSGQLIDSGNLTVFLRHYQSTPTVDNPADLYDHFPLDVSPGGRNAVPLATADDINNATAQATVAGYNDITVAFVNGTVTHGSITGGPFVDFESISWPGGTGIFLRTSSGTMTIGNVDGDDGPLNTETITGGTSLATTTASANMVVAKTMTKAFEQDIDRNYSVIVNCATRTLAQVYEYFKYVNRDGSSFPTYMTVEQTGLSINKLDGEQYIRAHEDKDTSANSYSVVKASPFGTFAGGKLFGAQGVWVENMHDDDIQAFQLIDATGTNRFPPNKQPIVVTNLKEYDRVSVFRTVSTSDFSIQKSLYTSHATNNTLGSNTFTVQESISTDTPATGIIRVVDSTDGSEQRYSYTSFSGSVFSGLTPTLDRTYDGTDTVYVPFIDKEVGAAETSASVTIIYPSADRGLLIRVRRKTSAGGNPPILPFEATGTFGATGFSIATIRTEDTIVT